MMNRIIIPLIILASVYTCNRKDKTQCIENKQSQYTIHKIACIISDEESFDTTFTIKNDKYHLSCQTECFKEYSINDTINDSTINAYQNRFLRFHLKNNETDTVFIITKDLIRLKYDDNATYNQSILVLLKLKSIDYAHESIRISTAFMYPIGLEGTDFFEEVLFDIQSDGKVVLKDIIDYENPVIE